MFAGEIRRKRVQHMRSNTHWRWRLDAQVQNHFSQERHLVSREIYKERRAAALAEWRAVVA